MEFSIRNRLAAQYAKQQHGNTEKEFRESDLAYLHSTVYTIIGTELTLLSTCHPDSALSRLCGGLYSNSLVPWCGHLPPASTAQV